MSSSPFTKSHRDTVTWVAFTVDDNDDTDPPTPHDDDTCDGDRTPNTSRSSNRSDESSHQVKVAADSVPSGNLADTTNVAG